MANPEHLHILKRGVNVWNKWRRDKRAIKPDLSTSHLSYMKLDNANFSRTNLSGTHLRETSLVEANLRNANLSQSDFYKASFNDTDMRGATLRGVIFHEATFVTSDLRKANLENADLTLAYFGGVLLDEANLTKTVLNTTVFNGAILSHTDFTEAQMSLVLFGDVDLSTAQALKTVKHSKPSTIGIDTIVKSQGNISEHFLRGAGVPDAIITYARSLINDPIEYYTCFISYSSKDREFAERLYADLQSKGVRCWYAPEDLKIGDKFWHKIDESIRLYDKLLVVLSKTSVVSTWVENEVMAALEKEHKQNQVVLFPIMLDDSVMETNLPWAANMRRTRHIGDFKKWKSHDDYQRAFNRLVLDP